MLSILFTFFPFMSSSASLSICTYHRGNDIHGEIKPYHWALFIRHPDSRSIKIHQLRGCPGAFYYTGVEDEDGADLAKSDILNNELEIGAIPVSEIGQLEEQFRKIPVDLDESTAWNCQDWAMDAVNILAASGWIWDDFKGDAIRSWLREKS